MTVRLSKQLCTGPGVSRAHCIRHCRGRSRTAATIMTKPEPTIIPERFRPTTMWSLWAGMMIIRQKIFRSFRRIMALFFARTAGERDSEKRGFSMFPITIPISVPPICSIPMWNRQTIMTGSIRLICADGWGRSAMEMRMCGERMFIRLQPACSRSVPPDFMRWMQIRNMRSASSRTCRTSRQQTGGT